MNQNTPNPRLALRWPHPRGLTLWIGHGRYSRNNPKPRWYWTPGVAAGKEWRWEKSPPQMGIMLNSRGERMTKALEGTEVEQQTPSKWGWETSGEQAVMAFHTRSSVALGDYPRWGGWPLINLITMHNNDLIWLVNFILSSYKFSLAHFLNCWFYIIAFRYPIISLYFIISLIIPKFLDYHLYNLFLT